MRQGIPKPMTSSRIAAARKRIAEEKAAQTPPSRGLFDPATLDDFPVFNAAKGVWRAAKQAPRALYDMARDVAPYDEQGNFKMPLGRTTTGLLNAQGQMGLDMVDAYRDGDYMTAATKGAKYLLPVLGPMMDAGSESMAEHGIAEGMGELGANAYMTAVGMRTGAARPSRVKPPVMRGPSNPKEAAAVAFARERGVPLDLATATGSKGVRGWQKDTAHSWAGSRVADDMVQAQNEGLTRVGRELVDEAAPGRPTSPFAAGEGVIESLDNTIRQLHGESKRNYAIVDDAQAGLNPRPAAADAMTALDASQRIRLGVDMTAAVEQLVPLYESLASEAKIGVKLSAGKNKLLSTLHGMMNAPNFAPLTTVERALSSLKELARGADMPELRTALQGGAGRAVRALEEQVMAAAERGGPEVAKALRDARKTWAQKMHVAEVRDLLSVEPGKVFRSLTQNKDLSLKRLESIERIAPEQLPNLGRALLEDMMDLATREGGIGHADRLWADWSNLGPRTKAKLFQTPGHVEALDNFFLLTKKMKQDPNPSGTGTMPGVRSTPTATIAEVLAGVPRYYAAKMMMTPEGVNRLTQGLRVPAAAGRTTRALAAAAIKDVSEAPSRLPTAAEGEREQRPTAMRGATPWERFIGPGRDIVSGSGLVAPGRGDALAAQQAALEYPPNGPTAMRAPTLRERSNAASEGFHQALANHPIGRALDTLGVSGFSDTAAQLRGEQPLSPVSAMVPDLPGKKLALKALTKFNPATLPITARARKIVAETLANGGYSVNPITGVVPKDGVMVGMYPNTNPRTTVVPKAKFKPSVIEKFYLKNKDALNRKDAHIGTWVDGDNVYIDVSQRTDSVRGATKVGEQQVDKAAVRNADGTWPKPQKAVFDLTTSNETPVGNITDFVNSPEYQGRLDELHAAGAKIMQGRPDWWDLHGSNYERVYGKENVRRNAGFLAATSPASDPRTNARTASEYMRRSIKGEPVVQPDFRMPADAVGFQPGLQMPFEQTRKHNIVKAAAGDLDAMRKDKVNDMAHALVGDDVVVVDRHYAKSVEDPARGLYANATKDKVEGAMDGSPELYAWIDNAVRTAAKRNGTPLHRYSAQVWEGIRDSIRTTGKLFGTKYRASAIPATEGGFSDIFQTLITEKAKKLGISVKMLESKLKTGDASLLTALLATPVGAMAYQQWREGQREN